MRSRNRRCLSTVPGTETGSEFNIMGSSTECPDRMHLRKSLHEPNCTLEGDAVRMHIAQCEACRAIVAGLEAGDGTENTLVDEVVDPAREPASAIRPPSTLPG